MKISVIMPTISWEGCFSICGQRIKEIMASPAHRDQTEFLVVLDGFPVPPPDWLHSPAIQILATGVRSGPAVARNLAAQNASGDILLFVDADVELHPESLNQIRQAFQRDPSLDALFGSYDADPASPGVVSRFRNLLHHHTHQLHPGEACTFWAGCGAIRRSKFWQVGGFDVRYKTPSIEDVELGQRLWRQGGRLILDPSIQACHHKHWTLRTMLATDIQQRAIPWSRLILEQGNSPATLNLSWAGRLSGALALLVPIGLVVALLPGMVWGGIGLVLTAVAALVVLNLSFHRLHWQRRGPAEAIAGIGLHLLHLLSASGTFLLMACRHFSRQAMAWRPGPANHSRVRQALVALGLGILFVAAVAVMVKGLGQGMDSAKDLLERFQEWQLFRDGNFPVGGIYQGHPPRGLRVSPYPAWAIPMFGLLFVPGGLTQGFISIQLLNLISLIFISYTGYRFLRPHGILPALFGAMGPLAFNGNVEGLVMAQFSFLVTALILLEWTFLQQQRPIAAGICWAFAMLKPQISLFHVSPLLANKTTRKGLWISLLFLSLLSTAALIHTQLNPLVYGQRFLRLLGKVQDDAGWNLLLQLSQLSPPVWVLLAAIASLAIVMVPRWLPLRRCLVEARQIHNDQSLWMLHAGLCSLVGFVVFYHRSSDNIMLAPTLIALADLSWRGSGMGSSLLTLLLGATLWAPTGLLLAFPALSLAQLVIWGLCAVVLSRAMLQARRSAPGPLPS
jgi:hypothetical protein